MKKKILHVIGDKRAGGSNIYVKRLVNSYLQRDFDFYVARLEEVKPLLKKFKPDLIVFHYPCAWKYLSQLFWLKQYGKVAIADHHYCQGFEQHQVSSLSRFRLMLRLAYGIADWVIAVSQAQRQWMIAQKLVGASKVTVISGAAPMEELLAIPLVGDGEYQVGSYVDKTNISNFKPQTLTLKPETSNFKPLVIGAYGRFAPQKGFDILLKAFALVNRNQFRLLLGGYGQNEQQIKDLSSNLPHVEVLGAIEDISAFLSRCDVIAIPSRWESWGLVCVEAKAAGKPVIASAVDGLCEQLTCCGLLVTPNSVEQLAQGINSLPRQPLAEWGEKGRMSVINAWDEFLDNWLNFLRETVR